jgi:hypothetical protein
MAGDHFSQVVVVDFEYEITPGGLPNPLCMVAIVLDGNFQYVRTIRMWRGEFGRTPPFDIRPGYVGRCLQCLGRDDVLSRAGLALPGPHL